MRINEMMDEYLLPHPLLDVSDVRFGITFERPDLQKMSVEQRMEEYKRVSEKVSDGVSEKVSENQLKILEIIKNNKFVTVLQLRDMLKISEKSVNSNLKKLKERGMIKRFGPAKGGHWEVVKGD